MSSGALPRGGPPPASPAISGLGPRFAAHSGAVEAIERAVAAGNGAPVPQPAATGAGTAVPASAAEYTVPLGAQELSPQLPVRMLRSYLPAHAGACLPPARLAGLPARLTCPLLPRRSQPWPTCR